MKRKTLITTFVLLISLVAVSVALAQSTSKQLSTNFTLINLGTDPATVTADYRLSDGSSWSGVGSANTNFTIDGNGGQAIFRQYDATQFGGMASGSGSVTLSSSERLGAVVQIQARNQVNSNGAYSGFEAGSDKFYVPLVSRQGSSADGTTNSQIVIQNTSSTDPVNVTVEFFDLSTGSSTHTETINGIAAGSSYYYDLANESDLPTSYFGSAAVEVSGSGAVAVVSNFFIGSDALLSFNGFPASNLGNSWVAPLVTSRLANGLSTPVTVQNLSGSSMAVGSISLNCTGDAANTATPADFTITNATAVVNNGAYAFNPVVDTTNFPTGWFGSCRVSAPGDAVAFVQMRFVGTGNAAAYEAINTNGTATQVVVPLIAKRLSNGFATALTIQNLDTSSGTNVTIEYIGGDSSSTDISIPSTSIPAGGSLIQNHRVTTGVAGGVDSMPDGWVGTAIVTSTGGPINAFVQLTNINPASGDTFMAHNAFTQ